MGIFTSNKQDAALDMLARVLKALEEQDTFRTIVQMGIEANIFPPMKHFTYTVEDIEKMDKDLAILCVEARLMLQKAGKLNF